MVSKTKVAGVAILVSAIFKIIADAFDGGGFHITSNIDSLVYAFNGLGFYFLREAVDKIKDEIKK